MFYKMKEIEEIQKWLEEWGIEDIRMSCDPHNNVLLSEILYNFQFNLKPKHQ